MNGLPDLRDFADPGRLLRFGILVVVAALAVAGVRELGSRDDGYPISAEFNRAGLNVRPGDEVRMRGVPVGAIEAIEIDSSDHSAVYRLRLDPGVEVATDSGARVVPKTMLGDKYVEVDPARPGAPSLAAGDIIPRSRTNTVAELEQVLDQLGVLVSSIDATALGASIAALGEGFGDGTQLRDATAGFAAMSEASAANREAIQRLLAATPTVAGTVGARSEDLASLATDLSEVAQMLADEEPTLAAALRENAELLDRAERLVGDPRFDRTVSDALTVLSIAAEHPGAVNEYLSGFPVYLEGLASATFFDTLYANVPHFFLGLPLVDARDDLGDHFGGRGPGPHVEILWDDPSQGLGGVAP